MIENTGRDRGEALAQADHAEAAKQERRDGDARNRSTQLSFSRLVGLEPQRSARHSLAQRRAHRE